MGRNERRDIRYRVELPVTVLRGPNTSELQTGDVSFRGLFLKSDTPLQLRQLVRVKMLLPPEKTPFEGHAMVVHVVSPDTVGGQVRPPGAGVQFYGVDGDQAAIWEKFVRWVGRHHADAEDESVELVPSTAPVPIRRREARHRVVLQVRLHSLSDLYTLYTRDVSRGGMFITTDLKLDISQELEIDIVHPATGDLFKLGCIVRHKLETESVRGVGVQFTSLDESAREALFDFISDDIQIDLDDNDNDDDEEEVFVEEGDPKLA